MVVSEWLSRVDFASPGEEGRELKQRSALLAVKKSGSAVLGLSRFFASEDSVNCRAQGDGSGDSVSIQMSGLSGRYT